MRGPVESIHNMQLGYALIMIYHILAKRKKKFTNSRFFSFTVLNNG